MPLPPNNLVLLFISIHFPEGSGELLNVLFIYPGTARRLARSPRRSTADLSVEASSAEIRCLTLFPGSLMFVFRKSGFEPQGIMGD